MTSISMDLATRAAAADAIRHMTEEDLCFLNRLIVERLKLLHQARSTAMLAHFSVGDRVSFQSSPGERKFGVIVRLNKKSASIITDAGQQWNVHPVHLIPDETGVIDLPARSRD